MTIWKYPLDITDSQIVGMPIGAKILTIQMQGKQCCLWAFVDETQLNIEYRWINIYGTGHVMPSDPGAYIATFQVNGLVFHAFESQG